jgi:DHA2 family multidrug resistance protein
MAILFVPLTTLALQDLKGPEIGQGAGLNNMMRQLGGSFGVALLTTLIHIKSGKVRTALLEYINPYNPAYVQRNGAMVQNFMANGKSPLDAQQMANRAMEGNVIKQTMLLTYDNMYLVIGLFVLFCIPIVYLQKFKKNVAMPADAH